MQIVTKLVVASVLALSVAAPAFAAEETTLLERNTYASTAPLDAMAYAPAHAQRAPRTVVTPGYDFGIGSQS